MEKSVQSPNSRGCLFCPNHEFGWHYKDVGHGPPLILLHGIGMSHFAWNTIINDLANERHVLAFDIPGFGITPPVLDHIQPTPTNLVAGAGSLAETLSRIDKERQISKEYECVDIVGNSLGGYMALEAAKLGNLVACSEISDLCTQVHYAAAALAQKSARAPTTRAMTAGGKRERSGARRPW